MSDHDQENAVDVGDEQSAMPVVDEGFHVVDGQSANWVVRKITEARRYADRAREWAEVEVRRAEREEAFLLQRFGRELEEWFSTCGQVRGKKRSVDLPAGRIGIRSTRQTLKVVDEPILLLWCRQHLPESIEMSERVLKTPLQSHFAETGELPPGVELKPPRDQFYIT